MNYGGANFLGVIANHINVGKLNKANVNKISQIKIYPFNVSAFAKLGLERFIQRSVNSVNYGGREDIFI